MSMKIYWNEMSEAEMKKSGAEYHACNNKACGHAPLIWQQAVGDAVCEGCGKWQNEVEEEEGENSMEENKPTQKEILFDLVQTLQNAYALFGQLEQTDVVKHHRRRVQKLWAFYVKKEAQTALKVTWENWLEVEGNAEKLMTWLADKEVDKELLALREEKEDEEE